MKNGWYDYGGNLIHYINNIWHNEQAPARIWKDGSKFWYQNHKYHRLDGPAFECNDGSKCWWYQGKPIECKSQQEFERIIKLRLFW